MTVVDSRAVEQRLWTSTDCYAARWQKSASALIAVQQALARHNLLGERQREFLDLYAFVEKAPSQAFGEVWADPRAYLWVRVAYELVKACLTNGELSPLAERTIASARLPNPLHALEWHLEQFKLFALGVAARAGEDLWFARSWDPPLPIAIPASSLSLSGAGGVRVHGLVRQHLHVTGHSGTDWIVPLDVAASFDSAEIVRTVCPYIEACGCQLWLQPHAFHVPAAQAVAEVLSAGVTFQWEQKDLVERTLAALERYAPESLAQFRRTIRVIALKPRNHGSTFNTSHSQLPGAFTASAVDNPLALADDFIHELHHNRLFAMEEAGPFFDASTCDAFTDARYYSPWRDDPRPLHGVLHGLYVFTRVTRYWLNVWRGRGLRIADRDYALDRLLRLPRQLRLAQEVLRRRATFSPLGQALFSDLCVELRRLQNELAVEELPDDAPALTLQPDGAYSAQTSEVHGGPLSVVQAVEEHQRLHDLNADCGAPEHDAERIAA